jgi:4,5:9,10-diseco-3-hydroxy-5,9,17-trioxoandrosta-1(10),2-diene-4-oate hydrolase
VAASGYPHSVVDTATPTLPERTMAASPAVPIGSFVDIGDGLRIHYHEAGSGLPVVFVHGSGPGASGYSNFKGNYPRWASAGFRTIVPDSLGFGYSSKPEEAEYTLEWLTDGLRRFVDALGLDRFVLVGNSLGGAMCIRLALDLPDRVVGLILMAPGGLEVREVYMGLQGIRTMMKAVFDPAGFTGESIRRIFSLQLHDPGILDEQTVRERLEIALTQPRRVFETLRVPHLAPELPNLSMPVLAFWGTDDKFCPVSGAMTIASSCRHARVMVLTECGHWVMVEHPRVFDETSLQFLRELA